MAVFLAKLYADEAEVDIAEAYSLPLLAILLAASPADAKIDWVIPLASLNTLLEISSASCHISLLAFCIDLADSSASFLVFWTCSGSASIDLPISEDTIFNTSGNQSSPNNTLKNIPIPGISPTAVDIPAANFIPVLASPGFTFHSSSALLYPS